MTEKRFRVTISNTNTVSFVDVVENKQLMSITFKNKSDAIDCKNALMYQCDLMNKLHMENMGLKSSNMEYEDALGRLEEENEDHKHLCKEYRRIKDRCCANSHNAHQFLNCYEKAINDLEEEYKGNNVAKEVLRKLDEYYDKYERKVVLE